MQALLRSDIAGSANGLDARANQSPAALMDGAVHERPPEAGASSANSSVTFRMRWQQAVDSIADTHPEGQGQAESIASETANGDDSSGNDAPQASSPQALSDPLSNAISLNAKLSAGAGNQLAALRRARFEPVEVASGPESVKQVSLVTGRSLSRSGSASATACRKVEDEACRKADADSHPLISQGIPVAAPVASGPEPVSDNTRNVGSESNREDFPGSPAQSGLSSSFPNGQPDEKSPGTLQSLEQNVFTADQSPSALVASSSQGQKVPAGAIAQNSLNCDDVRATGSERLEALSTKPLAGSLQDNHAAQPGNNEAPVVLPQITAKADVEAVGVTAGPLQSNARGQRPSSGLDRASHALQPAGAMDSTGAPDIAASGRFPAEGNGAGESRLVDVQVPRGTSDQNPFAAMDAGVGNHSVNWAHAGPQHAEAGYIDPALGWVTVRADLHGGSVHAAVAGSTADSAAVLGAELAGLNAHLAEKRIPIESVTIASAPGQETHSGSASPNGSGQQGGRDERQDGVEISTSIESRASSNASTRQSASGGDQQAMNLAGPGVHISVRV